jgi:hypothetical protein
MGFRIFLPVSTVLVVLDMLGFAQPAIAAPAEPYHTTYCELDGPFDIYEICYDMRGVVKENVSASGVTTVVINDTTTFTVTRRGEWWYSSGFSQHDTYVFQDGEPQVAHHLQRGYIEEGTRTCTYDLHSQFANGELRYDVSNFECSESAGFLDLMQA